MTQYFSRRSFERMVLMGYFVTFCLLCVAANARENVIQAKLGFDWLSDKQKQQLWEDVKIYAEFEGTLAFCGTPSSMESRVIEAVKACVTQEALQMIAARFRAHVNAEKTNWESKWGTSEKCNEPRMRDFLMRLRRFIDNQVNRVAALCRSCTIC